MALQYHTSPLSSPPLNTARGPDPLNDDWTYDSAIDLFAWNPILLDPFTFDLPDDLMEPDSFSGLAMPEDVSESVSVCPSFRCMFMYIELTSQDPESDDQPWSPPTHTATDTSSPPTTQSSPEITPKDAPTQGSRSRRPRRGSNEATPVRSAAKRAAHNVIEKRYRTNMNAKFVALEEAIAAGPARVAEHSENAKSKAGSASLKKSEILSNAIAYMHELQEENRYLHKEIAVLRQGYFGAGGAGIWRAPGIKRERR